VRLELDQLNSNLALGFDLLDCKLAHDGDYSSLA